MQLFCLPHAGGSATAFLRWRPELPADVEVLPIELAGRGTRHDERPAIDAASAGADAAMRILAQRRPGVPYAIWGHSMGSLVAYEALSSLRERTDDLPGHLIVSGRSAPHIPLKSNDIHKIANDDAFIAAVDTYGGGTKEALAEPSLRALFLPVLRADFQLSETYAWAQRAAVDCPITVVNGVDDLSIDRPGVDAWRELAATGIDFRSAPGGHFFLYQNQDIVRSVVADVSAALQRRRIELIGKGTQ
ncbi:thioesterase II family protein [Cryobacterium sp. 1639]|uniref:thioesterase II family protein n=1 Tax=Cryobacterium inferilacus TaxID=2866629 RepID=UPI0021039BCC|nr:alpha/beta fold hydrolase [Cryobacterium sp. 1639]